MRWECESCSQNISPHMSVRRVWPISTGLLTHSSLSQRVSYKRLCIGPRTRIGSVVDVAYVPMQLKAWRRTVTLLGQQRCSWWAGSADCVSALRGPAVARISRLWTARRRSSCRNRRRVEILAVTTVRCVWRRLSAVQGVSLWMKGRFHIEILS